MDKKENQKSRKNGSLFFSIFLPIVLTSALAFGVYQYRDYFKGEAGASGLNGKDGTNGTNGKDGENGKSAYELAVEAGFSGTLEEWLESLKGKDGKDGVNGKDGKDGAPGKDGKDGSNGKTNIEVAVDRLNSMLKTNTTKLTPYERFSEAGITEFNFKNLANFKNEFYYSLQDNKFIAVDLTNYILTGSTNYAKNSVLPEESNDLFKFSYSLNDISTSYANYLCDFDVEPSALSNEIPIQIQTSLDVGANNEAFKITYLNHSGVAKESFIRTNSFATVLNIKAPQDTVHHYGFAADVLVEENNSASYHEYGIVGRLEIKQGHFVAESTAEVFCLMDTREDKSDEAEAPTIKEGAKVYVGDTTKVQGGATIAENGVADKVVEKCLDGQHTFHRLVIDSQHIYDVCETCGYTIVDGVAKETSGKSTATAIGDVPEGFDVEQAQKCEHNFVLTKIADNNYKHKAECSKCGVTYNEAHTKTMGTYCACGHYNPDLTRIWWWPNPQPYVKKTYDSNAWYPDYTVPKAKLQVGQMLPIYLKYQTEEQLGTSDYTGWVAVTSSNPEIVKVTSNILVPIEECQYMKWYSYLYCVGEGTCTLTFEDETQSGLVKYDVEVTVTRETTIDKIDIGAYYTFGQFEFKDESSESLGNHDIEWVVLDKDVENNRIYVVSKDIFCDMKFDNSANKTATFDNSSIKTWLNGDFKNGFGENASKIYGDIGLLDYSALPYYDEDKWNYVAGTLFGDWNAAKAQHYGVEVQREGIGSGAVSSANSPSFWIIGEGGIACLGGQGQSYHNNKIMNYIVNGTTAGVRPAMWITLGE